MNKILALTIYIFPLFISNLFAYDADVRNISGREYYPAVKEVIDNAEESIHVSMFVVALNTERKDSVVYKLCNSLVEAKKRGIKVSIILDQNVNYFNKEKLGEIEEKNEKAYQFFKENGIDVYYDDKETNSHSKILVSPTQKQGNYKNFLFVCTFDSTQFSSISTH